MQSWSQSSEGSEQQYRQMVVKEWLGVRYIPIYIPIYTDISESLEQQYRQMVVKEWLGVRYIPIYIPIYRRARSNSTARWLSRRC